MSDTKPHAPDWMAARHAVTAQMQDVKFLYIATVYWGVKFATHYCVIVLGADLRRPGLWLAWAAADRQ